jgi:uncharacterized protein (TIGR04168 family)
MKLAVIGDVHMAFDEADVRWLNASDYDAVLLCGDLPGYRHGRALEVAAVMAGLSKPAFMVPGNHDATSLANLVGEVAGTPVLNPLAGWSQHQRVERLREALGPVVLGGYSWHTLGAGAGVVGLVIGRPHAMGARLSFRRYIARRYAIETLEASARELCAVVDACPHRRLVFLGHNGPTGLGAAPTDPWGADFGKGGDWGDPDLRAAIDHARATGREVLAVVAGHMHHRTKQGLDRRWQATVDGVTYVNAARVPRHFERAGITVRHHVALALDGAQCTASERLVTAEGP